eukprot:5732995-Pleurochrysis_carterae.AAC.5
MWGVTCLAGDSGNLNPRASLVCCVVCAHDARSRGQLNMLGCGNFRLVRSSISKGTTSRFRRMREAGYEGCKKDATMRSVITKGAKSRFQRVQEKTKRCAVKGTTNESSSVATHPGSERSDRTAGRHS